MERGIAFAAICECCAGVTRTSSGGPTVQKDRKDRDNLLSAADGNRLTFVFFLRQ